MQVALAMQLFETVDDLGQYFSGFAETEYFVLKFSLVVDEIASIAIFQKEVDIIFILTDFI